jgi:LysR family hydrogen peroxide-inducible transcriptional activator
MLDLTRIRYFQAVAEAGSFSQAARRLGLSQPTLSIQVARLEQHLGTPLFQRRRDGVTLTETGRRLLEHSRELLSRVEEMEQVLRSELQEPSGDLRIGCVHSVGIYLLPEALAALMERYPKVHPTIRSEHSQVVLDLLKAGEIDVGLTAHFKKPPTRHNQLLVDDPLVLVCGPGHRLWGRRYLRPQDLDGEKLVAFDETSPTAQIVDRVIHQLKVKMQAVIRAPQIDALIRMVRINMGVAFIPRMAIAEDVEAGRLHAVAFSHEELQRGIWMSWNKAEVFPARDAFLASIKQALAAQSRGPRG